MKRNKKLQSHDTIFIVFIFALFTMFTLWTVANESDGLMDIPNSSSVVYGAVGPEISDTIEFVDLDVPKAEPEYPKLYTEEDAIVLAKMLWGEARGVDILTTKDGRDVSSECQQAAVIWVVLNRYDANFEDSIIECVTAKSQFIGYKEKHPVDEKLLDIVYDVLNRWNREKHGEEDVGRVIPSDYHFFVGKNRYNWFSAEWKSKNYWDWSYTDVYA